MRQKKSAICKSPDRGGALVPPYPVTWLEYNLNDWLQGMHAGTALDLGVERSLEFEVFASGHASAPSVQSSCLLALPSR